MADVRILGYSALISDVMYRFARYHSLLLRYALLCLCIAAIVKVTSIHSQIDQNSPLNVSRALIDRTTIGAHRQFVRNQNLKQYIRNRDLYSSTSTRYILLVQVHKRVAYLRKFIEMLGAVAMINQTLIVFSHDFIDPDINALVTNITFAPVSYYKLGIVDNWRNVYRCICDLDASNFLPILTTALSRRVSW